MRKWKIQKGIIIGAVTSIIILFVIKFFDVTNGITRVINLDAADKALQVEYEETTMDVEDFEKVATKAVEAIVAESIRVQCECVVEEVDSNIPDISGIEETCISDEAYSACIRYGGEYSIVPELLMAVIERESEGNPDAFNGTDSGLMQIAQKWHYDRMERIGVTDLFDTDQNIHTGADFLAELFGKYEDVFFVLMVYNMGYETANEYYSQGIISEYAIEIVERADKLQLLHRYGGVN